MTNTADAPAKINLRDYAERLAISLGWHWIDDPARGGDQDPQILTREKVADTVAITRAKVPYLVISQRWQKDKRIEIRGAWPYSVVAGGVVTPYGKVTNEVTVDARREPAVVARDIGKRLLPDYLAAFETCLETIRDRERHREAGRGVAERLCKALRIAVPERGDGSRARSFTVWHEREDADSAPDLWASVEVRDGGSVKVEATGLTEDQARRILEIVKGG